MLCRALVLLPFLACVLGAQAREPKAGPEGARQVEAPVPEDIQQQKRREVLRQATRLPMDESAGVPRQLSPQERADLRQQLQQQRLELLK